MRAILLSTAMFTMFSGQTLAGDGSVAGHGGLSQASPVSWEGMYLGVNGGRGGGSSCWEWSAVNLDTGCHDVSGNLVGGQLGYNWQAGKTVFGVELSSDWSKINGSHAPELVTQNTDRTKISRLIMAAVRVGYAWEKALLYVKSGALWADEKYSTTCNGVTATGTCTPVGSVPYSANKTQSGGFAGAGVEYQLNPNLTLGLEADYLPIGKRNFRYPGVSGYSCGAGSGNGCPMESDQDLWMATARLNWRFVGP